MTPLDLRDRAPRGPREALLGFYFLARTIDKLRAELPGGNLGAYVNEERGLSAYAVRRLGLDMDDLRRAVAEADDEAALLEWLSARIDRSAAPALNAKFETFVVERMTEQDKEMVRRRHPVMKGRPELTKLLDIIEADDVHVP